ncbi:MAG: glycoside hydrolase family 26 protein, partial [Chloroflexota bacterium]|nr:glycoside hydrolase family 26 protein [Chloroflexota bacterium]
MDRGPRVDAQRAADSSRERRDEARNCVSRRRRGWQALLVAILLTGAAAVPAPATAAPGDLLGVFPGSGNTAGAIAFGSRTGRTLTYAHDFLDRRTWSSMNDVSWLAQRWLRAGYTNRLVLTVPMIPDAGGTLASGAAGNYNQHFRTLAETLVGEGQQDVILRIGHEFNGDWYRWTIDVPNGGPLYAAYWRQIVTTMRAVPGSNFRFDWSPNNGSSWTASGRQLEAETAWPGDAYVDFVGLDVYDQSWASWNADPVARWGEYLNAKNGMRWHATFAAAHGKPMTFPEWALAQRSDGNGGGDSAYFVEQMYWWIRSHDVAYHLYFESPDPNGEYGMFSGYFPNGARRFVEYFGPHGLNVPATPPATADSSEAPLVPRVPSGGTQRSPGWP